MRLPQMTTAYIAPLVVLGVATEMTLSYFYHPQPFLSLFQWSTALAAVIAFFPVLGMTAFMYNESPIDERVSRLLTWMIGISAIVLTTLNWGKYFLMRPNEEFNEHWFKGVTLLTVTAVLYTTMGFITWRLLRSKNKMIIKDHPC